MVVFRKIYINEPVAVVSLCLFDIVAKNIDFVARKAFTLSWLSEIQMMVKAIFKRFRKDHQCESERRSC